MTLYPLQEQADKLDGVSLQAIWLKIKEDRDHQRDHQKAYRKAYQKTRYHKLHPNAKYYAKPNKTAL